MAPPAAGGGSQAAHEGDWICANCGTVHESNDQPCRECAGERFARLEAESTPDIDSSISVEYRCKECGRTQPRNSTPCKNCGNLTFDAINHGPTESPAEGEVVSEDGERQITIGTIAKYASALFVYAYSGFALLYAAGFLAMGLVGPSILMLVGGIVACPPARTRLESLLSVGLSRGAVVVAVLVVHGAGLVLAIGMLAS